MPALSHADSRPALLLRIVSVFLFLLAGMAAVAQDPAEIEFRQALKDMSNDLRLMCVAAHPDDEDGATLAYYRYKHGVKTYALIGTRGEGGQNEIGPELYEDLAVIRTKEMMEAARIEGAELHFLDMPEFGFSKTIEETLEKWGKDVLLEKMVRKIREIRPHVIITHHGRMKDHGHHQAIGWAVQEAFTVAADANAFPESGKPWQVQRLYIRDFTGESKDAVVVDINEKDELRGKTYAEIAADALRAHKSQGMEQFIEMLLSGDAKAYYDLVKQQGPTAIGAVPPDLFGAFFEDLVRPVSHFQEFPQKLQEPKTEIPRYLMGYHQYYASNRNPDDIVYDIFDNDKSAAIRYAQISMIATAADPILVPNQSTTLTITYQDAGDTESNLIQYRYPGRLGTTDPHDEYHGLVTPEKPSFTQTHEMHYVPNYLLPTTIPHYRLFAQSQTTKHFVEFDANDNQGRILFRQRVPVLIDIAPPVLPEFIGAPYLLNPKNPRIPWFIDSDPFGARRLYFDVRLTNYTPGSHEQKVRFTAPTGWLIEVDSIGDEDLSLDASNPLVLNAKFEHEDQQLLTRLNVVAPAEAAPGSYALTAETEGLDFTPEAKVQVVDMKTTHDPLGPEWHGKSGAIPLTYPVGLIDSYDTTLRDTMTKLDMMFSPIEEGGITEEGLRGFGLIIVDMRAYAKRPDLKANNAALLEWCKRGGTLIVNYHKTFDWSPDFAPYPISLSNNRVTREDAPVKLLVPEHPWFNTPNKIAPEDWDGWRQERGLYFPQKWDDAYTPLIETTDPDEVIPPGSCLIADYGEGKYFYTSLVWYRQLRELPPGALKLFANMLAL